MTTNWRGLVIDYRIHDDDGPGLKDRCSVEWEVVGVVGDGSEFVEWILEWRDPKCIPADAQAIAEAYAFEFSDELETELVISDA